jgi:hypothetical protein
MGAPADDRGMRWVKGIAFAAFTLCVGGLLLYSGSGFGIALGITLIVLTSVAAVSRYRLRPPSQPRA